MPKLNIHRLHGLLFHSFFTVVILLIPFTGAGQPAAETEKEAKVSLPATVGKNWTAVGAEQFRSAQQCAALPNQAVYLEYGLKSLTTRQYANGKTKQRVEVFELRYPSGAYGIYTFNRAIENRDQREFFAGRYLVAVSAPTGKAVDDEFLATLKPLFPPETNRLSPLPDHLPEANKIAESEIYLVGPQALAQTADFGFLKEIIKFDGGTEAVTADYRNGDGKMALIIIEYHTPQLASDGYESLAKHHASLSPSERNQRLIKRVGNYVVAAVNVRDPAAAQQVVEQIKYTAKVYWEGDKFNAIPLEFRPPDQAALEEAAQTASIMIRAFYWIGVMLMSAVVLGLVTGGGFFYWRRYQRRKLGTDDLFSDAGETIRLNLDEYLLHSGDAETKRLGKRE